MKNRYYRITLRIAMDMLYNDQFNTLANSTLPYGYIGHKCEQVYLRG